MKITAILFLICLLFIPASAEDSTTGSLIRVIYFSGMHCPACDANKTVFLKFEDILKNSVKIEEGTRKLAKKYGVEYIPTLIILDGEKMVYKKTGVSTLKEYTDAAKKAGLKIE